MDPEEIDERYHHAALDDGGEAWPEEGPREAPAAPAGSRTPTAAEPVDAAGGRR